MRSDFVLKSGRNTFESVGGAVGIFVESFDSFQSDQLLFSLSANSSAGVSRLSGRLSSQNSVVFIHSAAQQVDPVVQLDVQECSTQPRL